MREYSTSGSIRPVDVMNKIFLQESFVLYVKLYVGKPVHLSNILPTAVNNTCRCPMNGKSIFDWCFPTEQNGCKIKSHDKNSKSLIRNYAQTAVQRPGICVIASVSLENKTGRHFRSLIWVTWWSRAVLLFLDTNNVGVAVFDQ